MGHISAHTMGKLTRPSGLKSTSRTKAFARSLFNGKKVKGGKGAKPLPKRVGGKAKAAPKKAAAKVGETSRYYDAEDNATPIHRRFTPKTAKLRKSLTPGTVCIILSGKFRGVRCVFLKQLESGLLLVTGPYASNGCPLRRVNQRYVIATSTKVSVPKNVALTDADFAKIADEAKEAARVQKLRAAQAGVDKDVKIEKGIMEKYMKAKFTLKKGDYPHDMVF